MSFVSSSFALHVDRELTSLKSKLVVTTPLGERILNTLVFKGCEILVEDGVKSQLNPVRNDRFRCDFGNGLVIQSPGFDGLLYQENTV